MYACLPSSDNCTIFLLIVIKSIELRSMNIHIQSHKWQWLPYFKGTMALILYSLITFIPESISYQTSKIECVETSKRNTWHFWSLPKCSMQMSMVKANTIRIKKKLTTQAGKSRLPSLPCNNLNLLDHHLESMQPLPPHSHLNDSLVCQQLSAENQSSQHFLSTSHT